MKKTVIFDLDGTLIDSIQDIAISTNKVLEKLGFQTHPLERYTGFVGDGALMLLSNALPKNVDEKKLLEAVTLFKKEYGDKIHTHTKPYDGIYEMLDILSQNGFILALLSNKPHEFTVKFMEHFFADYNFVEIHGQKQEVPKKPHPQGIFNIAKALNLSCDEIYFVGDTVTDIKTAQNSGVTSIAVSWGYRDVQELIEAKADFVAKTPLHLVQLIQ